MKNKTAIKFFILVFVIFLIIEFVQFLLDDVIAPGLQIGETVISLFICAMFLCFVVSPFIRKDKKITVKEKMYEYAFGPSKYRAIRTSDGSIFLNYNDIIPWKRNSKKIQDQIKIGKQYIIITYRPWPFSKYRNIIKIKEVKTSFQRTKK